MTAEIVSTCCCSNCPDYAQLEVIFMGDMGGTPQNIVSAYINAKNSLGNTIAAYDIIYGSGSHIEDFMTGFSELPISDGTEQIGSITWITENTDTSSFINKTNQGDLYLIISEKKESAGGNLIKYTRGRCEYHAANVNIDRAPMTGFNIRGYTL